jgi:hypothetical protein
MAREYTVRGTTSPSSRRRSSCSSTRAPAARASRLRSAARVVFAARERHVGAAGRATRDEGHRLPDARLGHAGEDEARTIRPRTSWAAPRARPAQAGINSSANGGGAEIGVVPGQLQRAERLAVGRHAARDVDVHAGRHVRILPPVHEHARHADRLVGGRAVSRNRLIG